MFRDLKHSLRALLKQPVFAGVAVVTLALGIGAATALFSVVNAVLLEPLPYNEPDSLFALRSMDANGLPTGLVAPRFVEPLYQGHPSVDAAAIGWSLSGSILASDGTPYPFMPYRVTSRFFDVFKEPMALGRGFEPDEPPSSIILSHQTWQNYFGADPDIVGAPIVVDDSQRTVVGVTRPGFSFPAGAESWQTFTTGPDLADLVNFQGYLRLRPGVPAERFEAELSALSDQLGPNTETGERFRYVLRPLLEEVVGDLGATVVILSGATLLLLLIACLNVANLLFARANARAHEVGVRQALGAGRGRILRQLLTESLLLAAIGGAFGVVLAYSGVRILLGIGPANLPRLGSVTIEPRVLAFSAGAVLLTTILVGLAPAVRLSRTQVRALINRGGRGRSAGRGENRVFGVLVAAEVGLALMLVAGAGLLIRSYVNLATTESGVADGGVLWLRLNPTHLPLDVQIVGDPDGTIRNVGSGYQPVIDFYHELMDRLETISGVSGVTGTQVLPLLANATDASPEPFTIMGRPEEGQAVRIRPLATDFFSTMGVPILSGRDLGTADRRGAPGVALVNEAFVRQYFAGQDPVGWRVGLPSGDFEITGRGYGFAERIYREVEIVGVVPDLRFVDLVEPVRPNLFMSADQFTTRLRVLAVRTELEDPRGLIPTIRREIAAMAPSTPVEVGVYSETVNASISRERLATALLAVFGAIAFALASVGVYGVMSYSVTQRTREIALRAALGASGGQILGLVVRSGVVLAGIGVVAGLVGTYLLRQVVQSQLYGVSALDPGVLILVPVALLGVAVLASLIPARRASRIDPAEMLRLE